MATKKTKAPEEDIDWSQFEDSSGFEDVSRDDLGIPFLEIIQKGSPEVDEDHNDHAQKKIDGAKVGCIFNTVTREILYTPGEEGVIVQPCSYKKLYVEWHDRKEGGGIVASHDDPKVLSRTKKNEKNEDVLENGNVISTTAYFFCNLITEEGPEHVMIAMRSTQLKKARNWLNMMMANRMPGSRNPKPMFSRLYRLSTVQESNQKGTWRGWSISQGEFVKETNLLEEGRAVASQSKQTLLTAPKEEITDKEVPY